MQKRTLKPVYPPAAIEKAYKKRLEKAVREMEKSVLYWLRAKYRANEDKILDSATDDLLKAFRKLLHQWERNFRELADVLPRWFVDKIKGYVHGNLAEQVKPLKDAGLGFNLKFSYMSQKERQTFAAIVNENVNLIKSIASENLTQVEGIVLRSIQNGHDLSTLTEELHKQFGVTERRAAMIARDQTNKATENLSRQRLKSYGITKGIWMHTASGKTYRETHVDNLDGQEYDLEEGLYDPAKGVERNIHPAELVNCYCVCRPLIPQLSEEETEQGIEEIFNELGEPLPETPKAETAETQEEKQEIGFVPANTIKEADAYMMDKFGIQASYKGVDVAVANEWNFGITNCLEEFPELKQNFGFVGEAHNRSAIIKERVTKYVEKAIKDIYGSPDPSNIHAQKAFEDMVRRQVNKQMGQYRINGNAYAISYSGKGLFNDGLTGVCVNSKNVKTLEGVTKALKRDVASGWSPLGCDTLKSLFDHEAAHQLDALLELSKGSDILVYHATLSPKAIEEGLSGYAKTNVREFIAEAWAEYRNNPKPRPIAKKVGDMIIKEYKRKYKGARK